MKKFLSVLTGVVLISTTCMAATNKMEILGTYGDWTAYSYSDPDGKVCYIASSPIKSAGKYKKRDDVFLIVTHRPKQKTFNVINTVAGYTYKKGSKPSFSIDKNKAFSLSSYADTAWAKDNDTDKKIVNQLKKGNKAVLSGSSVRGTKTTDTFSLKGFSKAYQEINKACGYK